MEVFHERLQILYEEERTKNSNFGRKAFAKMCNIPLSTINNYLSGKGWPNLDTLKRMSKNLQVNVAWLIGESELRKNAFSDFYVYENKLNSTQIKLVKLYINYLIYMNNRIKLKETHGLK